MTGRPWLAAGVTALYTRVTDRVDLADWDEYLDQHIRYLGELDDAGHVLLAGSFTDMGTALDGFALFATTDKEEVQELVDADPALGPMLRPDVSPHAATNAALMDRFGLRSRRLASRRSRKRTRKAGCR